MQTVPTTNPPISAQQLMPSTITFYSLQHQILIIIKKLDKKFVSLYAYLSFFTVRITVILTPSAFCILITTAKKHDHSSVMNDVISSR